MRGLQLEEASCSSRWTVAKHESRILEAEGTPSGSRGGRQQTKADDWRVAELYIERRGNRSIVGNIYKGKVDNVLPGLEAAFVDIGLEKNGFLHADDLVIPGRRGRPPRARRPHEGQADRRAAQAGPGDPGPGDQGPAEDEGPAPVDAALDRGALPRVRAAGRGRRRVAPARRQGARPAAQGRRQDRPPRRAARSSAPPRRARSARTSSARSSTSTSSTRCSSSAARRRRRPEMVFQEADLSVRVARDIFSGEFERAIVDDRKQHHRLESFFTRTAPELLDRLEFYEGERAAVRALRRRGGDPVGAQAPGGPARAAAT